MDSKELAQKFIDALHALEQGSEDDVENLVALFSEESRLTNVALQLAGHDENGRDGAHLFGCNTGARWARRFRSFRTPRPMKKAPDFSRRRAATTPRATKFAITARRCWNGTTAKSRFFAAITTRENCESAARQKSTPEFRRTFVLQT